jgi:outer membrane protein assembly factor BamB
VFVGTHFPETREFYRARFGGVRLVGSISGHWHGTRVWHDGEAAHWTSSTTGFGGIDFTPRGYRVVDVDEGGVRSRWETVEEPSAGSARVTGRGVVAGGRVVVACEAPDASGSLRALDGWARELDAAARGGVTGSGSLVYALDLNATVHALDAATGTTRWSVPLGDSSARWTLGLPLVVGDRVYAGSAMSVHAIDAEAGRLLWRTDLASADWAASWSGVTADETVVVIGAMNDDLHLAALEPDTGALRWRHSGRDFAGVCATPVIAGRTVLALRAPGWLSCYGLGDGALAWEAPLDDAWPVALTVAGARAIVRAASGTVTAHGLEDGSVRWRQALGPGRRAGRAYARTPGGARVPLVVAGDLVVTATFDELVALDLESGTVVRRVPAGGEVATLVASDDAVVAVTVDGATMSYPPPGNTSKTWSRLPSGSRNDA